MGGWDGKKINLGNEINKKIRGKKLRIKSAITVDIAGKHNKEALKATGFNIPYWE